MANILGGLNYDAVLSSEDYRTYRNLVEKELLDRFLLSAGAPPYSNPLTGIVDVLNPTSISSSETARPFLVSVSTINSLNVKVNAGLAVTPSGALLDFSGNANLSLARTQNNDINVIFVENEIVQSGIQTLNDYMENLYSQDQQNSDMLRVALISDWNNTSLFPPSRKNNIVVIAVVTVIPTAGSGQELQVDLTQNSYSFNRPWFSIVDIQHRASIGTGTVTTYNPHGMSYNDLSTTGNVGLFQGLANTGLVVSRDRNRAKMTGAVYCVETIPLSRIKTDSGGVTSGSPYGRVGAQYCELEAFPTRLGSVYEQNKKSNSIAAEVIEGTNLLVFGPNETISSTLTVEYTDTSALLPPVTAPTNFLTFGVPTKDEAIVAGGLTLSSIPDPTVNLEASGPFPRRYFIYQLGTGSLVSYPQVVIPATKLDALGTTLYAPPQQLQQPARIRFGLTKANMVSSMSVSITLYGKDIAASTISEVLTISTENGYVDEVVPSQNYDSVNQSVISTNTYAQLNYIQITSRTDDGPLSTLQVWAEIEPSSTPELNDAAKVAEVYWNGQGVTQIKDARRISRGFTALENNGLSILGDSMLDSTRLLPTLSPPPATPPRKLFTEDFENLKYFDSFKGFYPAINSTGTITIQNNGAILANDTITLRSGKILTATTGSATPSAGQFQIGSDASATRSNIIATINDSGFDSKISASSGSGNNINLTLNYISGAIGNTIALSTSNGLAFSVMGFKFGYDPIGECYFDRSTIGIKSFKIPSSSNLIPYTYDYRERYRSRAVAIPYLAGTYSVFSAEVHEEDLYLTSSIRIRGATLSAPYQWTPWAVMSPVGAKGLYSYTFSGPVHKIQVEYYGRSRGISVYQVG